MLFTHSLTGEREAALRMRMVNPASVKYSNSTEALEMEGVIYDHRTLAASNSVSGKGGLFRGLLWLKTLLVLFFTGLVLGGLLISVLQGGVWETIELEDLDRARSALETITSLDMMDILVERNDF